MNIVTYSLSASGPSQKTNYHEQLIYSVRSLRTYNKSVPIHVFLYGEHPSAPIAELEDHGVSVHQMGAYVDAIRRIRPRAFRALAHYPVLHKWLNFSELGPLAPSQILQADCDTFFFDDIGRLFERYSERQFYAREEPASKASHYGYDPFYIDEDALFTLARREGAVEVNPYNIGVCLLNQGLWTEIAKRSDKFLSYVFRFAAHTARNPQTREKLWPGLAELLAKDLAEEPEISELPFPSSNLWILDQVALWLTLGQIPGLTHGFLSREHVIQGGEQTDFQETKVVHHYFGIDKIAFLSEISKNFGL
ncbi:MAG: hypothetical protein MN733_04460 [Nitrososphaera sp.]|nr:hypothetical protein [Nitrososphaera sp.]